MHVCECERDQQRGYNHVFLSRVPQVVAIEAPRPLTANGIALQPVCGWSHRDELGDECGISAVSWEAGTSPNPSFMCGRSAWDGGTSACQLTNVDSTLTTMKQRCPNNVLADGNLRTFRAEGMRSSPHVHFNTFWKIHFKGLGEHSALFIWQRLGRLRLRHSTQPTGNSCCSQQHFLFVLKVDRVALALSPLEATWRTKPTLTNKANVLLRGDDASVLADVADDGKLLTVGPPGVGVGFRLPIWVGTVWSRDHSRLTALFSLR